MRLWSRLRQLGYHPVLRIDSSAGDATAALIVASLAELTKTVELALQRTDDRRETTPEEPSEAAATGGGLDKDFVIDLCNQIHRLGRAAKPFQSAPGQESSRLNRGFELVKKVLKDQGVEFVDMTGDLYHPDQTNFELLGEPEPTPELDRPTILVCERPLVRLHGKLIQPGKGIVGKPLVM